MTRSRDGELGSRTLCEGSCHCGALCVELELTGAAGLVPVRECSCSFCRKHGARMISDPLGSLVVRYTGGRPPLRYRFATHSVEFLLCGICGVLVGALSDTAEGLRAVVNARVLTGAAAIIQEPETAHLDGESAEARSARHARTWTPVRLETGPARRSESFSPMPLSHRSAVDLIGQSS